MMSAWRCETCRSLLGIERDATLYLKNKTEETIVRGADFVVTKTCRRCGTTNELRPPAQP